MAIARVSQYPSSTLPKSGTTMPHDPHLLTTTHTNPTDPNLSYQPRSPGFLHKVITERNSLRTQNAQLKLAVQKQQLIIKKLQGVIIKEVGYRPSSSNDRSFRSSTSTSSIVSHQYQQDRRRRRSPVSTTIPNTRRERPIKFGSNEATLKSLIPVPHHSKPYHHQDDILKELMDPPSSPTTLKSHHHHHHDINDNNDTVLHQNLNKVLIQPPLKSPLRPRQVTRPQHHQHQSNPSHHHTRFSSISSKDSQPSQLSSKTTFPTISISSTSSTTIGTPTSDIHHHLPTLPAEEDPLPNLTLPTRRRKFSLRKIPVTNLSPDQLNNNHTDPNHPTRGYLLNNTSTTDETTNNRTGTYHAGLTRKPKSKPSYQFKRPVPLQTIQTELILPPYNGPPPPSDSQPQPPLLHYAVSPLSSISSLETVDSPLDLHHIQVQVLTCSTRLDTRGREMFTFRIEVTRTNPDMTESTDSWIIEKTYLELFELNTKMRETGSYSKAMGTKFPSKSRWNTKVPSELEKGKIRLQDYLKLAVNSQRSHPHLLSDFLTTGKIHQTQDQDQDQDSDNDIDEKSSILKGGYLIKQDRDADHDKKFYFKLMEVDNRLDYYTKKDGKRVGEIQLINSQVTQLPTDPCLAFQKYPYSFELLEPKRNGHGLHRHVMNTDTNESCEAWVTAIEDRIKLASNPTSPPTSPPARYDVMAEFKKLHSFQGSRSFETQRETTKFKDSKRSSGSIQSDRLVSTMVKSKLDSNKLFRRTLMWGKKKISDLKKPKPIQAPIFGVTLRESVMASKLNDDCPIPMIVFRCIEYLDTKEAHLEEGIYRISGSTATIDALKEKFKTEGDYNILESGIPYDVNAVSGLLKFYLRELASSVLTKELFGEFNRLSAIPDRRGRVRRAGELMTLLPFENYTLLRTLFAHLTKIAAAAPVNKMTLKNIGIIFSPTLGIPDVLFCLIMVDFPYIFAIDHLGRPRPRHLPPDHHHHRFHSHQKSPSLPPPRHFLELPPPRANHLSMSFLPRSAPSHLSMIPVSQASWVE